MTRLRPIPWARFGFEGVLIVFSILAAFSIQAWWESRGNREQEGAILAALAGDFDRAAEAFDKTRDRHADVANAGQRLIEYSDSGGVPEEERDIAERFIGRHFARGIFDPPMGTVQSVISSGRIDLIENPELVAELTRWTAVVARLNRLEVEAREHFYGRVYPFLATKLNLKDLDKGYRNFLADYPFQNQSTDAYLLVDDEEFINIVYMHWVLKTNILNSMAVVESVLERIRSLVASELQRFE